MATAYKRGKIYWISYYDKDGKRIAMSSGLSKKRDAEKMAQDLESQARLEKSRAGGLARSYQQIVNDAAKDANAGELTLAKAQEHVMKIHRLANPDFRIVSVAGHLDEWIKEQEPNVTGSTSAVYYDAARRFTDAFGKRISSAPVGELREQDILTAREKIRKGGKVKASTINLDVRCLRRALAKAVSRGLAVSNPAEEIRPLPERDSTVKAPFTLTEVNALIKATERTASPDEWKGAITIAVYTGLRMGDVFSLTSDHIDGTNIIIKPKKTDRKKKVIVVPLTPPCIAWIADRQGEFFPKLSKVKRGTTSTTFTRIMAKAGVDRDIIMKGGETGRRSFHSLRHTFTSWLAEADIHADVRQKLTGHSSAGIHARYTHQDEALKRAIKTLPSIEA